MDQNSPQDIVDIVESPERLDALRAVVALLRDKGIEGDFDTVPARWSMATVHDLTLPGVGERRLKARFRVTIGPVEGVEEDLAAGLAAPDGIDRATVKALARRVKATCQTSDAVAAAIGQIDAWVASVAERTASFGSAWRPKGFADELVRVLGFGGRIPRLQNLLDALEEAFRTAAANAGVKVRRHMLETASGLGVYLDSFTTARAMVRRLRLFVGPTNSGKTHAAMDHLAQAGNGAYLAPLRLLALEGQEALESRGRGCSLITGEERDLRPGADFVSSTIEMANTTRVIDTCVIDEIQMIGDNDRGWAWTQAVAGIAASEIIMTGSADAIPYVKRLAIALAEDLEVVEFTRKSPLKVQEEPVALKDVKRGDAVIAFSRRDVLAFRNDLMARGHAVSVIYGALSPEVRRAEAKRFREGQADVLVATDAIGMGLNLPIARIVLSTTRKFDGREERELTGPEIRQIGGRAGRYGMHEEGRVAVLEGESINPVRRALTSRPQEPEDPRPWISPATSHVEAIAQALGTESLAKVLRTAGQELLRAHQTFRMTDLEGRIQTAIAVDPAKLPLKVRDVLSRCPIDVRDMNQIRFLRQWATSQGRRRPNPAPDFGERFSQETGTDVLLESAEKAVKDLTAYAWLAYRFTDAYPEMDLCQERRRNLNAFIERTLSARSLPRACPSCGRGLKPTHRFRICDPCRARQGRERENGRANRPPFSAPAKATAKPAPKAVAKALPKASPKPKPKPSRGR